MAALDIRLFGAVEIWCDHAVVSDFRSQKELALLAYLISVDRRVTREYLAGLAWPDVKHSQALGLLRRSLYDLNTRLSEFLDLDRHTVQLCPDTSITVDTRTFANLITQEDAKAWAQAVSLYHAPFLQGIYIDDAFELESWLDAEQRRWQQEVVELLNRLITYHIERAEYTQARHYVERLLALEPWREEAHRQAILLCARTGQWSAALVQYERCLQTLRRELDVEPSDETKCLHRRVKAIVHMPLPSLPPATTSFIGREIELAQLAQLLAGRSTRLITLVGMGGTGKTRLAVESARTVVAHDTRMFLHGAIFVPLIGVDRLGQLIAALAQSLSFVFQGRASPETQLLSYLSDKEILMVLDNFEHLINGCNLSFLLKMINTAPDVKLLITSRSCLGMQIEQCYWIQGLQFPEAKQPETEFTAAEVEHYSSIRLFIEAVRRTQPNYILAPADVPALVKICQLVEGMPLALELAAVWMNVFSPAEIATQIAQSLDFLASEAPDLPLRQRNMRIMFNHSWRLLTTEEQTIFVRLSVFRGGFTVKAAQAVCDASSHTLMGLVSKSLVRRTQPGRFEIHELLRQWASELLEQMPDVARRTCNQHAFYYCNLLKQRAAGLKDDQLQATVQEIDEERENIQVAWDWTEAHRRCSRIHFTEYRIRWEK